MLREKIEKLGLPPADLAGWLATNEWEGVAEMLGLPSDGSTDEGSQIGEEIMEAMAAIVEDAADEAAEEAHDGCRCPDAAEDGHRGECRVPLAEAYAGHRVTATPEWCRDAEALLNE